MEYFGLQTNVVLFVSTMIFCSLYSDNIKQTKTLKDNAFNDATDNFEVYDSYIKHNDAQNNNENKVQIYNHYVYDHEKYSVPILRIVYFYDSKMWFMDYYKDIMIENNIITYNHHIHICKKLTLKNVNNDALLFETYKTLY